MKISLDKILMGLAGLCLLAVVGIGGQYLYEKVRKPKVFDGNQIVEALKPMVKFPDRLVLSPDPTAEGKVQLSYTYLSEEEGSLVGQEIVATAKKFHETIVAHEAPITMITIVSFNPKTKKPLRLIIGTNLVKEEKLLEGVEITSVVENLQGRCRKTTADVLTNFCNVSDALVTAVKGTN